MQCTDKAKHKDEKPAEEAGAAKLTEAGAICLPRGLRREFQNRIDEASRRDKGDGQCIVKTLGEIAREVGVGFVTGVAHLGRTSFYRTFNGKIDPRLQTIVKLARTLGLRVHFY